ncbi:ribosome rescue protein RqcH [Pyrococcus horikoshii]|uniref:Archaeal Rqc2 homolog aRqcH n=2 Tax=Pyrococcus horikoshii TaxID=53953 RepID=O59134_PYRHO|nr:ribosome rescue protein RqcH [Pyrococcus horikoshii]BAA30572.1 650aa long hypothetical protein [Pyrococcus horikoshii OT3]HII60457.1 fibronectin-binding domain-containing protein [Pyrococcus horikoshii]
MKEEMSSVDIRYIVEELKSEIIGARVDKVYHEGDEVRIKLHKTGEGRKDLIIEAGKRIHLTSYIKESSSQPSSFAMLLRKHISGNFVEDIEQHDFDRIVKIKIGKFKIIAELFKKGNVVFVTEDNIILGAIRYEEFKDRVIKPKHEYKYPPARENPLEVSWDRFVELIMGEDTEIVRALARRLNMGGLYAEEILLRAGIDKRKNTRELTKEELRTIYDKMKEVFTAPKKPNIVYKDGKMVDVVPIDLKWYEGYEKVYFETFSQALDEYFGKLTIEKAKAEKTKKLEEKRKQLLATLKRQEEMIKGFEKELKKNQEIGNLIYANYTLIDGLLREFSKAVKNLGWDEFKKRIEEGKKKGNKIALMVKGIEPESNSITVEIEGKRVKLYLDKDLNENAEIYYEKAKKAKHKLEGARKAYEDLKRKLESIEREIEEEEKKIQVKKIEKRKKKWFEKFRWFISSEGFLVIGGKDATTNEIVVRKYLEENDLYCHADIWGAPHVVIKDGQKAGEKTIFEACQFAVSMSRAWSEGLYSADAYWVYPNQVKKQAPSGEFLPKGAFMVYGKRNWMYGIPLKLAVGIINYEGEDLVMCGPVDALKTHAKRYIVIRPGDTKKSELVKKIKKIFEKWGYKVPEEDIMSVLPPGEGDIAEVVE